MRVRTRSCLQPNALLFRAASAVVALGIASLVWVPSFARAQDSAEAAHATATAIAVGSPAGSPAAGAVVRGTVRVLSKRLFRGLREEDDRSGVLVYLTGFETPPSEEVVHLEQRKERFEPRVLPIVAGQTVSFPNRDDIYHNVFSVSLAQAFDLGQYRSSDPPRSQTFHAPGLVPVYCNIHPEMLSYVVVLENDGFSMTGKDGSFVLAGVPAGRVTLNAWAPGAERISRALDVSPGDVLDVDLDLHKVKRIAPHRRKDGSLYPDEDNTDYRGG